MDKVLCGQFPCRELTVVHTKRANIRLGLKDALEMKTRTTKVAIQKLDICHWLTVDKALGDRKKIFLAVKTKVSILAVDSRRCFTESDASLLGLFILTRIIKQIDHQFSHMRVGSQTAQDWIQVNTVQTTQI
jgi:hypothetical protein